MYDSHYCVKSVQVLKDYQLLLTFATGEKKQFDMKPYLNKGIFKELRNKDLFNQVKICFDSIAWENGADIDPEGLYQYSKSVE